MINIMTYLIRTKKHKSNSKDEHFLLIISIQQRVFSIFIVSP